MTREEAIKVVRNIYQTDAEKEALETLIPELKESEDERIIKTLQEYVKTRNWNLGGPTQDEVLAWLEKQKYDRMKPIYDARESFESALEKAWNDYHNGYENVDKLEDNYVQCAHAKGFREGYLFGIEKQEGRKPEQYSPLCNTIKDKIQEYVVNHFVTDTVVKTDVKSIVKAMEEGVRLGKEEQEPGDNETEVQKAYREGKNAGRKEVFDHPEYYGLQLRRMYDYETGERNLEWSEEDKRMLAVISYKISQHQGNDEQSLFTPDEAEFICETEDKLKSLRPQPKQERNEEDEKVRKWLLEYFYLHRDDLRGASVTSMEILSFLENRPGNGKACDVDEFSLTLRNCLSADSELTDEQADTFVRAYGEDLYKVALGEMKSGADIYDIEEYRNEVKFDPKPGEKFWVRCKTDKSENRWFEKGDERPGYAVTDANGFMTYIVHLNIDGNGNCVSWQGKKKFLETFDIVDEKTVEQWPKLSNCKHDCRTCFARCLYRKERNPEQ